jgi:hypothetical protein
MICAEKTERVNAYQVNSPKTATVRLTAVLDETNKSWAKYTPAGYIELSIDNPAAVERFQLGQAYYVDFTEAPRTEAEETQNMAT